MNKNTDKNQNEMDKLFQEGIQFASKNDYNKALEIFIKMLNIEPEQPKVMYNAAIMCDLLEKTETAVSVLKELIEFQPEFPDAYYYLGKIYLRSGIYEEAAKHFKKTVKYDINHIQAIQLYRQSMEQLGHSLFDSKTDLVFYIIGGKAFHGDSIEKEGLGGSESALIYITRELAKSGYKIKVFTNCDKPGVYSGVEYCDLTDFYIYKTYNRINKLISVRSLRPFEIGVNADYKAFWVHDNPNVELTPEIIEGLNKIITISNWQKQVWMEEFGIPEDKIITIQNGIDLDLFKNKNIVRKNNKLIYTCQPQRGLEPLLEMFSKIREKRSDIELHLLWYESDSSNFKYDNFIKGNEQSGIFFHGSVNKTKLAEELLSAKLFVYPAHVIENFCIAVIEAQAAGTPVISSDLGAMPETIENSKTGFLIEGLSNTVSYQDEFIDKALFLLNNEEEWQKCSNRGIERSETLYKWSDIAKIWESELYYFNNFD